MGNRRSGGRGVLRERTVRFMPPLEGEVAAGRRGSGLAIGLAAGKLPGIVCIQTAIPLSAEAFRSEKPEPLSQLR